MLTVKSSLGFIEPADSDFTSKVRDFNLCIKIVQSSVTGYATQRY